MADVLIQIRGGAEASLPAANPARARELLWTTDTKKLFINDGTTNKLICDTTKPVALAATVLADTGYSFSVDNKTLTITKNFVDLATGTTTIQQADIDIEQIITDAINLSDIDWSTFTLPASQITFTPVTGIVSTNVQGALTELGLAVTTLNTGLSALNTEIVNTNTSLASLTTTVTEMNTTLGEVNDQLILTNENLKTTNEDLYGELVWDPIGEVWENPQNYTGNFLRQRIKAGQRITIEVVKQGSLDTLVINAEQPVEAEYFSTTGTLNAVIGQSVTLAKSTLTPVTPGALPSVKDTVVDGNGRNGRITDVDDVNSEVTIITFFITPSATFSSIAGAPRDNLPLKAELEALEQAIEDVADDLEEVIDNKLDQSVVSNITMTDEASIPTWKKTLKNLKTGVTSTAEVASFVSSNNSVAFEVTGTAIDITVDKLDAGSWD